MTRRLRPDADGLAVAAELLRAGELVAFPTETVYGLGADALDAAAAGRIYAAKGRPADNPMIVHLADRAQLPLVTTDVTALARRLAARWWPGPLTLVLQAGPRVPRITTGGRSSVAVRVPDHPVAAAVLSTASVPVAAPSANRSGRPSPTSAEHVLADLDGRIAAVLDGGACPLGVESTVVDARGAQPVVLREGSVSREELGLPPSGCGVDGAALAASPGTRYRHYAPDCPVEVVAPELLLTRAAQAVAEGRQVAVVGPPGLGAPPAGVRILAEVRDPVELAQRLYQLLRDAEAARLGLLLVAEVPEVGVGRAVMDRLRRAAVGSAGHPGGGGG